MEAHIHQSNLIEGFDSDRADRDSLAAWKWLIKQPKLTHGVVCKLQKQITTFQTDMKPFWRGYYRDLSMQRVYIGDKEAMAPGKIKVAMKNLLAIYPFTHPKTWHVEFEKIHPFVDGNGRTGRMLMWYMEIKHGDEPTLITYDERATYYAWFKG